METSNKEKNEKGGGEVAACCYPFLLFGFYGGQLALGIFGVVILCIVFGSHPNSGFDMEGTYSPLPPFIDILPTMMPSNPVIIMNKNAVLFHLKEAREELEQTIAKLENSRAVNLGEFQVAMMHLYHHLNTAWNGKDASAKRHRECAQKDFDAWRKFPTNAELFLDSNDSYGSQK